MNEKLSKKFAPGHATCSGCGIPSIVRTVLDATDDPVIVVNATGCLEVTSTLYPNTSWKVPYIHSVFENAGATAAGIESAYRALKKRGKIKGKVQIVVFAGDGGTYDIGLQALSGALERGHDFLYVCYDNQGYMNTGGQRSGATPFGADMSTTPPGSESFGNPFRRKDLMRIVEAHDIEYLAQASVAFLPDLTMKAKKAFAAKGPKFLLVLQPCTQEWKFDSSQYVNVGKLATETNFWPLYEIDNGKFQITKKINKPKPVEEFLKTQGRFKHLFKPKKNEDIIKKIQEIADENWRKLVGREEGGYRK